MEKSTRKIFINAVRSNLEWLAKDDTDSGITTIDTFDKQLASHLRTVRGAARDALSYMNDRSADAIGQGK